MDLKFLWNFDEKNNLKMDQSEIDDHRENEI